VTFGDNITVIRTISAEAGGTPLTVTFMSVNATETVQFTALGNGAFTASFLLKPLEISLFKPFSLETAAFTRAKARL
jgi:hypothetical protein